MGFSTAVNSDARPVTCFAQLRAHRSTTVSPNDRPIWQIDNSTSESTSSTGRNSSRHSTPARLDQFNTSCLSCQPVKAERVPVGATSGWGERERQGSAAPPHLSRNASQKGQPLRGASLSYVTRGHYFVWVFERLLERQIGFQRFSLKIAQSVWCPAMLGYFYPADVMHGECHGTKLDGSDTKWADKITTFNLFLLKMISVHLHGWKDWREMHFSSQAWHCICVFFRINALWQLSDSSHFKAQERRAYRGQRTPSTLQATHTCAT